MDVVCPRCSAKVAASAVNLDNLVAKCVACDSVFRIEGQLGMRAGRVRVPRPPSITVIGDVPPPATEVPYRASAFGARGRLEIVYRWWQPSAIFMLFFSIVWCGFIFVWYSTTLGTGAPLLFVLFPLLHVAVGIGLFYSSIAQILNRTRVVIDGRKLTVRHGPLPWRGNQDIDVDQLRQLFVHRRTSRGKNSTTVRYALCADLDGAAVDLVRGLSRQDEAQFIEQVIEDHLAIADDASANVMA